MKGRSRKLVWSEISTYLEHDSTDFTMFIWIKSGPTLFQGRIGQEDHLPSTLLPWHKCYETESQNTMMLYLMHKLCQCHYEKTLFTVQVCVLFTFVAMACCSKPVQTHILHGLLFQNWAAPYSWGKKGETTNTHTYIETGEEKGQRRATLTKLEEARIILHTGCLPS